MSYKVLARKYRPSKFNDLIGQESLVTILTNAIKSNKIAHAILLSGIRGVGKTTTARIIAKTINCKNLIDGELCGVCDNCISIAHPDIIEVDAASKTGVGDIREIIENCNYLPLMGKYKIYIIDEIHMLSNNAFNALLKTLEEPPAHVIFIFATTEVKKIPVTILSRCQRFDLRRITKDILFDYLKKIAKLENINIEDQALRIIIDNSEGSVRDSLSLLDQTIHLGEIISAKMVTEMLGYSNIDSKHELLDNILKGNTQTCLDILNKLYYAGSDPVTIFEEILELIHLITKYKVTKNDSDLPEIEISYVKNIFDNIQISKLSILWQMLNKAISEIKEASIPLSAAEMMIIRLCYSSGLPTPISLLEKSNNEDTKASMANIGGFTASFKPLIENSNTISSFTDIVNLSQKNHELLLYHYLTEEVHLVKFEIGNLNIRITKHVPYDFHIKLSKFLYEQTKEKWSVQIVEEQGEPTMKEKEIIRNMEEREDLLKNPQIKAIFDNFEKVDIKDIRRRVNHV